MSKVSDEHIGVMLAGLEGVTPGPWSQAYGAVKSTAHDGEHKVASSDLMWGLNRDQKNAAHIARFDPDTMRLILTELQSLRSQAGVSEAVEGVIDQVLEAERYAPKIVPMGTNPPLFDGMQPDNDGPWLNRVDVAKRLRAALYARPAHIEITEAVDRALNEAEAWNEAEGDPADTLHHGRSVIEKFRAALQGETK